jgi:hypothetical protein
MIPGEIENPPPATSNSTPAAHADARPSPTPATARSRSARTITSSRPTRRSLRSRGRARHAAQHRGRHRGALRAGPDAQVSWSRSPATQGLRLRGQGDQGALVMARRFPARPMPRCSAPPRATACAWPTPTLSSRSSAISHDLRRGSEVRRRQGDPRRHGPEPAGQRADVGRHGHHQRADRRSLGHRQGRHRLKNGRIAGIGKAGNPDVQPGVTIVIGAGTEVIAGEGHDRHRRRHRQPHPLHLPAADRRGADVRRHHHDRRRHRAGHRHQRHHLHARAVAHRAHARGGRGLPDEPRLPRQGQRQPAGAAASSRSRPAPSA